VSVLTLAAGLFGSPPAAAPRSFDGAKAAELIEAQVAMGPRVPGTPAHGKTLDWLIGRLESVAARVERRDFPATLALTGEQVRGTNVIASFAPERSVRIFFGAHWDTRAHADKDPDPSKRTVPVPGASDGASGVALLLVLAEELARRPAPVGVDLVFFDVEDQGAPGRLETYCLGSKSFAAGSALTGFSPRYGVIVDMIGHRDLRIYRDGRSTECCGRLVDRIFRLGRRIAPGVYDDRGLIEIYDDHVPFIEMGIPTVVLAGYGYDEWHTVSDLPEICDPKSLESVGNLLLEMIYEAGFHENP